MALIWTVFGPDVALVCLGLSLVLAKSVSSDLVFVSPCLKAACRSLLGAAKEETAFNCGGPCLYQVKEL